MGKQWLIVFLVVVLCVVPFSAQEDEEAEETPALTPGIWTYSAGGEVTSACYGSSAVFDPYEDYAEDSLPEFTLIAADDGNFLLIQAGADYRFAPSETDSAYIVSLIDSQDLFTFEGTMEIISLEEFVLIGTLAYDPACTYTGTYRYSLVEASEVLVWSETERVFSDISFFNECLDTFNTEPAPGWAAPDLLAVITETETGLEIDGVPFLGSAGEYVYEEREETFTGIYYDRITLLGTIEAELFDVNHFYQLDERTDCQVEYDSEYVPFDGDVEALIERIVRIDVDESE